MTRRQACADFPDPGRPLYARVLRLRHLNLGGLPCFLLFEGMITLGVLLALAELVPWWGVLAVPAAVAVMVKVNDLIAGAVTASQEVVSTRRGGAARRGPSRAVGRASLRSTRTADEFTTLGLTHSLNVLQTGDTADSPRQRARQSAVRRYE